MVFSCQLVSRRYVRTYWCFSTFSVQCTTQTAIFILIYQSLRYCCDVVITIIKRIGLKYPRICLLISLYLNSAAVQGHEDQWRSEVGGEGEWVVRVPGSCYRSLDHLHAGVLQGIRRPIVASVARYKESRYTTKVDSTQLTCRAVRPAAAAAKNFLGRAASPTLQILSISVNLSAFITAQRHLGAYYRRDLPAKQLPYLLNLTDKRS